MRRVPILATALVLAAVAVMVALGIWQLQRAGWKADLLRHYDSALEASEKVPFPYDGAHWDDALYRLSEVDCTRVITRAAIAGRNDRDEAGWAHTALCGTPDGEAEVALGWSNEPANPEWEGGPVGGIIGPKADGVRLIAMPAVAGLEQLAKPDPSSIPNNHMSYAIQWFFFAATALVIYALALRKRLHES